MAIEPSLSYQRQNKKVTIQMSRSGFNLSDLGLNCLLVASRVPRIIVSAAFLWICLFKAPSMVVQYIQPFVNLLL